MKQRILTVFASAMVTLQCSTALAGANAPGYPAPVEAPAGAPNVLVIMTDDVGFAASSTFGGGVPTPTFDQLAQNGLRYNNFHTTALCSPTRAALLTGRNHHAVGFGNVADLARGEPGYTSLIPKSAGTVAQILSGAGYDTAMLGKHHNTPTWQEGPLGPFDQWPSGLGFRYFYGFNGGHTDQFSPSLVENNSTIETPQQKDYILDRDLADRAVNWLKMQRTQSAGRPFLLYYAPGTAHTPLHAPANWLARFRGKFDNGWDAYREETFKRQKRLGIVPADAKLAAMPPTVRPWASLSADEKRVEARFMEAYAAALAYCDDQIGRVINELRQRGQLNNTLVVFVQGDNGAEGSGAFNYTNHNGRPPEKELAHSLANIDAIGGPRSYSGVSQGWAVALNTPFPYHKAIASRLGGIRNGLVVSWPDGIKSRGVRTQFTDVSDITPTILEATGVKAPEALNGVTQQPFDGVSFRYSFSQPAAPAQRTSKYFEMMGHAAYYENGWLAAQRVSGAGGTERNAPWQLYNLGKDFSQSTDVSAKYPEKLAELQQKYANEAQRNNVPTKITNTLQAILPYGRPEVTAKSGRHVFYPSTFRYTEGTFPSINNRAWTIEADVDVPASGAEGMLVTQGGRFSGWGLVLLKGVPTFLYRGLDGDEALFRLAAPQPLSAGRHRITVSFTPDRPGIARGGEHELRIDGQTVATGAIAQTMAFKFSPEGATVGHDTGTPLSDDYAVPFPFNGTLRSVTVDLGDIQIPQQTQNHQQPVTPAQPK